MRTISKPSTRRSFRGRRPRAGTGQFLPRRRRFGSVPGDYEFTTLVTDSNLVAVCLGTIVETPVFLETVQGA